MTYPVYIGQRQVAACTTPEAQAAATRLLLGAGVRRRRIYCWMTGSGMWALPNGDCPECGKYGLTHRELGDDECGSFVDCDRTCGDRDDHDGHPCALLPDHEGKHDWRGERR